MMSMVSMLALQVVEGGGFTETDGFNSDYALFKESENKTRRFQSEQMMDMDEKASSLEPQNIRA